MHRVVQKFKRTEEVKGKFIETDLAIETQSHKIAPRNFIFHKKPKRESIQYETQEKYEIMLARIVVLLSRIFCKLIIQEQEYQVWLRSLKLFRLRSKKLSI